MNNNIKAGADIHAGNGGYSIGTQEKYDEFVKGRNESLGKMKIKQLAEQATTYIEPTSNSGEGWIFDKEKFAELIVRECVRYFNEDYVRDFDILWREDLSKGMKQHFGVE
jgi:hypothetical protein